VEPLQGTRLAALEDQIATLEHPGDLLALATAIDDLGRQLALELMRLVDQPDVAAPLKPVLIRVPVVHTRALLRAAEKLDDAGSPRRAARVLIEALRKSLDANLVDTVASALAFTLQASGQHDVAARVLAIAIDPPTSRREWRARSLAVIDELPGLIDWNALDDELGLD
jgi:hypothetical protein